MEWNKQRKVAIGQRVKVYLNWNKGHLFSLVDQGGSKSEYNGLVCGYAKTVTLTDVVVKYNRKMQEMTCCGGHKNVHAWVIGTLVAYDSDRPEHLDTGVYYNPRVNRNFEIVGTNEEVKMADEMHLERGMMFI